LSDIQLSITAKQLVDQHGGDALTVATRMAEDRLADRDLRGWRIWLSTREAILDELADRGLEPSEPD
jgi:hypothetical protein